MNQKGVAHSFCSLCRLILRYVLSFPPGLSILISKIKQNVGCSHDVAQINFEKLISISLNLINVHVPLAAVLKSV